MTTGLLDEITRDVTVSWSHPRDWRTHPLAATPYWVETEVQVLREGVVVDQLSWSTPLTDDHMAEYGAAIALKWQLLG